MLDLIGGDATAARQDELVVAEALAVRQLHEPAGLVDPGHLADDELDSPVEERPLGPVEVAGTFAAHGDVHEAGLIGVGAGLVDDGDRDLAAVDPTAQLAGQQVRGQGAANATAEDQDAVHRRVSRISGSSR